MGVVMKSEKGLAKHVRPPLFWFFVLAAIALVSGYLGSIFTKDVAPNEEGIIYADFVVIMLTAIAVIMTMLAIIFAVLGFIGWNSIADKVRERATDFLSEGFEPGQPLRVLIKEAIQELVSEDSPEGERFRAALQKGAYEGVPVIEAE